MTAASFSVGVTAEGANAVVTVSGELDVATAGTLIDAGHTGLPPSARTVTVDISGLLFLDSAGCEGLIAIGQIARASGATVAIMGASPLHSVVLHYSGLAARKG